VSSWTTTIRELLLSVRSSTSAAPWAFAWNRPPRLCGGMESSSARRGVSADPGRRNRRLCSDLRVSFDHIFCNEQAIDLAGSGKPVKNVETPDVGYLAIPRSRRQGLFRGNGRRKARSSALDRLRVESRHSFCLA
jgi:hypothetical protein